MNYPLISIIVPVYNVERYLRRCVDSLLNQIYPNLEILLIDDGSPDNSWDICMDYVSKYPNIKAFKKENGGLSSARNFGLDHVNGEYVGFIDSDDWVEPEMYDYLYRLMRDYNADATQIKYELAYASEHKMSVSKEHIEVIKGCENILEYYMEQTTATGDYSVCICLFKASNAKKYKFREGKTSEDMDYKFKVLSECTCFVSSNQPKYHYFQGGNSISSGKLVLKNFQLYESAEVLYQLCESCSNSRTRFLGEVKKARTPFSLLSKAAFYGVSKDIDRDMLKKLVNEHRSNLPILLKSPMPLSRKIVAIALSINLKFTQKLISFYKKISGGKI